MEIHFYKFYCEPANQVSILSSTVSLLFANLIQPVLVTGWWQEARQIHSYIEVWNDESIWCVFINVNYTLWFQGVCYPFDSALNLALSRIFPLLCFIWFTEKPVIEINLRTSKHKNRCNHVEINRTERILCLPPVLYRYMAPASLGAIDCRIRPCRHQTGIKYDCSGALLSNVFNSSDNSIVNSSNAGTAVVAIFFLCFLDKGSLCKPSSKSAFQKDHCCREQPCTKTRHGSLHPPHPARAHTHFCLLPFPRDASRLPCDTQLICPAESATQPPAPAWPKPGNAFSLLAGWKHSPFSSWSERQLTLLFLTGEQDEPS